MNTYIEYKLNSGRIKKMCVDDANASEAIAVIRNMGGKIIGRYGLAKEE